jgi:hypothetical protein
MGMIEPRGSKPLTIVGVILFVLGLATLITYFATTPGTNSGGEGAGVALAMWLASAVLIGVGALLTVLGLVRRNRGRAVGGDAERRVDDHVHDLEPGVRGDSHPPA